jgi:hypothetical protein
MRSVWGVGRRARSSPYPSPLAMPGRSALHAACGLFLLVGKR